MIVHQRPPFSAVCAEILHLHMFDTWLKDEKTAQHGLPENREWSNKSLISWLAAYIREGNDSFNQIYISWSYPIRDISTPQPMIATYRNQPAVKGDVLDDVPVWVKLLLPSTEDCKTRSRAAWQLRFVLLSSRLYDIPPSTRICCERCDMRAVQALPCR